MGDLAKILKSREWDIVCTTVLIVLACYQLAQLLTPAVAGEPCEAK